MPSAYSQESRNISSPYPDDSPNSSIWGSHEKNTEKVKEGARSVRSYFSNEVRSRYTSLILVVCYFASGIVDTIAFNVWGCFVAMQAGNTVFAALGLSSQRLSPDPQQYSKPLVSIGSFMLGTLFFNFLHRYPRLSQQSALRRRSVFILSFSIQTLLIITAATLVHLGVVTNRPAVFDNLDSDSERTAPLYTTTNLADLAPIALLAFEAAGQVCLSRVLEVFESPMIVLSTLYHDFTADLYGAAEAWRKSGSLRSFFLDGQQKQGRRAASILALFLGAVVGGEMLESRAGMSGSLFLVAGLKGAICIAWILWKGEDDPEYDDRMPK